MALQQQAPCFWVCSSIPPLPSETGGSWRSLALRAADKRRWTVVVSVTFSGAFLHARLAPRVSRFPKPPRLLSPNVQCPLLYPKSPHPSHHLATPTRSSGPGSSTPSEGSLVHLPTSGQAPLVFIHGTPCASGLKGHTEGNAVFLQACIPHQLVNTWSYSSSGPQPHTVQKGSTESQRLEQINEISAVMEDSFRIWNSQGVFVSC